MVKDQTSCTPSRRYGVPLARFSVHTAKCIQAADRIADLVNLPSDSLQHTPLFTCMLTLSAVVHLSAYVISKNSERRSSIRERLALSVGALKGIKGTWEVAGSVLQTIKAAAREVMSGSVNLEGSHPAIDQACPYGPEGAYQWVMTAQDPLFTEVPELLPTDQPVLVTAAPSEITSGALVMPPEVS